jgi:hypothetical protein
VCGLDATRAPSYLFIIAPGFQAGISGQHFPKRIAALKGRAFKGFHGTATIFALALSIYNKQTKFLYCDLREKW